MAASPAFQFYPADFIAGTVHLTNEELGAYMRLLCFQWEHGSVPNSAQKRARVLGISTRKLSSLWSALEPLFTSKNGYLVNPRMEEERHKQAIRKDKLSKAGRKGGQQKATSQNEARLNPSSSSTTTSSSLEEEHTELATSSESSSFTDLTPQPVETQSPDPISSDGLVRVSASESEFAIEVENLWAQWPSNRRPISPQQLADLMIAQGVTTLDAVKAIKLAATEDASSLDWREGVIPRIDNWVKQRQWDRPVATAATGVAAEFAHLDEGINR